jgi:hypothetical protein
MLGINSTDIWDGTGAGFLEVLFSQLYILGVRRGLNQIVIRFLVGLDLHETHFLEYQIDPLLKVLRRLLSD